MSENSGNTSATEASPEKDEQSSQRKKLTEAIEIMRTAMKALIAPGKFTKDNASDIRTQLQPVLKLLESYKGDAFAHHVIKMQMNLEDKIDKMASDLGELGLKLAASSGLAESNAATLTNIDYMLATNREKTDDSLKAATSSICEAALSRTPSAPPAAPSYLAIAQAANSREELARQQIRKCQMLFDYDKDATDIPASITITKELITAAVKATEIDPALDAKLITWTKLNNGGVLFELASEEAVKAIMESEEKRKKFEEAYGYGIKLKTRTFTVIVHTVPVFLDPTSADTHREWEKGNGFPEGSITNAGWIKKPHERFAKQTIAFVRLRTSNEEVSEKMLAEGLIIDGSRVTCQSDHRQALTCVNCWRPNHFQRDCRGETQCGRCTGPHRANVCTVTDPALFACVQCNEKGHASSDRMCPSFRRRCAQLDKRRGIQPPSPSPYQTVQADTSSSPQGKECQDGWMTVNRQGSAGGFRGGGGSNRGFEPRQSDNGWRNRGTIGDATGNSPGTGQRGYKSQRPNPSPLRQSLLVQATTRAAADKNATPATSTASDKDTNEPAPTSPLPTTPSTAGQTAPTPSQ